MRNSTIMAGAAGALVIGGATFLAGFSAASAMSVEAAAAPIVDPAAWSRAPEEPAAQVTVAAAPACSPWEVSDIAMEEILDEMRRRGWRPPSRGEAIASINGFGADVTAEDPFAPIPSGVRQPAPESSGESYIAVLTDEQAEAVRAGEEVALLPPS